MKWNFVPKWIISRKVWTTDILELAFLFLLFWFRSSVAVNLTMHGSYDQSCKLVYWIDHSCCWNHDLKKAHIIVTGKVFPGLICYPIVKSDTSIRLRGHKNVYLCSFGWSIYRKKLLLLKFNLFINFIKCTLIHCKVLRKKNGIKAKKDKSKQDENFVKQKSISDYS